jgi:hypothetical protein
MDSELASESSVIIREIRVPGVEVLAKTAPSSKSDPTLSNCIESSSQVPLLFTQSIHEISA